MNNRYLCSCGMSFDEPKAYQEPDGFETPPYRYSFGCPYCGSDDYAELIEECDNCGNGIYTGEKYYRLNSTNDVFCENCITERDG